MKNQFVAAWLLIGILSPAWAFAGDITGKVNLSGGKSNENIIVFVEGPKGTFSPPKRRPTMNHINLQFEPRRLAVLEGTTVDFPNSDPVLHSAFSISKSNPFELGIYGKGFEKFMHFKNSGLVEIFCHIHSHMHAFVMVLENPYYAHTSKDGSFTITGVPAGDYQVEAWLSPSVTESQKVTVSSHGKSTVNFSLKSR